MGREWDQRGEDGEVKRGCTIAHEEFVTEREQVDQRWWDPISGTTTYNSVMQLGTSSTEGYSSS